LKGLNFKGIYFIYDPLRPIFRDKSSRDKSSEDKFIGNLMPFLSFIQIRSTKLSDTRLLREAVKLKELSLKYSVKLIINNRVDIALLSGADGVHLGKEDIPVAGARKIFKGIIGASRHTIKGALGAQKSGADYIGAGPVFKTTTKDTGRSLLGVKNFKKIADSVDIPVIPVGGINSQNIFKLKRIAGCAALSFGIQAASDPLSVCRDISKIL
jgi:thiamine-phosphate pyrophosphorylase